MSRVDRPGGAARGFRPTVPARRRCSPDGDVLVERFEDTRCGGVHSDEVLVGSGACLPPGHAANARSDAWVGYECAAAVLRGDEDDGARKSLVLVLFFLFVILAIGGCVGRGAGHLKVGDERRPVTATGHRPHPGRASALRGDRSSDRRRDATERAGPAVQSGPTSHPRPPQVGWWCATHATRARSGAADAPEATAIELAAVASHAPGGGRVLVATAVELGADDRGGGVLAKGGAAAVVDS